ncbi:MAG: peroxide stress protein YaaA, partial [Rubripirellula sp.]
AFRGDVYQGLDVDSLSAAEVRRSDKYLRILSGLYGVLRPLDLIQPYRLEMGTKLTTAQGKDLYQFWGEKIRDALSADLRTLKSDLVVNLASKEYARVAKLKSLDANVISPHFKDWKNGQFKMISFFAKQARGMMAQHIIKENVKTVDGLIDFKADGYSYNKKLSTDSEPVFTRKP